MVGMGTGLVIPIIFGLVGLAIWAGGVFVVVYLAARLAIRHERRNSG